MKSAKSVDSFSAAKSVDSFSARILAGLFCLFAAAAVALAQAPSHQDLLSQADQILQQMSEITGLPIKSPVKKEVISRPEIEKYLIQNLHDEMTPQELHAQEALARALGLVPKDFDLEKFLVNFYTEQVAGFYDPKRKTMFIADWIEPDLQSMVLAHELTHALQDQSWDLENFVRAVRDNDDASAAREAVVEGYATAAMMQQMTGGLELGQLPSLAPLMEKMLPQQFGDFPALSTAPYFFRAEAMFPYVQGLGFIQAGLQHGGWKDLNVLFHHPPELTRQIYQPQIYFAKQPLIPDVPLPHPPALEGLSGLRFLTGNSLGELGYRCLLGQLISEDEANAIGPSWVSDKYLLYESSGGKDYTLVARVLWATPQSSQAFFRHYQAILAHKYPELTPDKRSGPDVFIAREANGVTLLLRSGDECRWAEGVPAAQADAMLEWLRGL